MVSMGPDDCPLSSMGIPGGGVRGGGGVDAGTPGVDGGLPTITGHFAITSFAYAGGTSLAGAPIADFEIEDALGVPTAISADELLWVGFEHGALRGGIELVSHEPLVGTRQLERAGPVASRGGGLHTSDGHPGIERVELCQALPPVGRGAQLAPAGRGLCQRLERRAESPGTVAPLRFRPPLELRRPIDEKPVEKRTLVGGDGRGGIAPVERVRELGDVGADESRIEPQLGDTQEDRLGAEGPPEGVHELGEPMRRALAVRLGPEIGHELVTAGTRRTGAGQQRQKRQRLALGGHRADGAAIRLECGGSENAKVKHGDPAEAGLIPI